LVFLRSREERNEAETQWSRVDIPNTKKPGKLDMWKYSEPFLEVTHFTVYSVREIKLEYNLFD
jgi:hypothetical protein